MSLFVCPVCRAPLKKEKDGCRCARRHCFDISSKGYVHLLPASKMHAKIPGDNKEMVRARSAFLNAGYYEPFAKKLSELALALVGDKKSPVILDAGCGEGYYTACLHRFLLEHGVVPQTAGIDISKFAAAAAAKRCPDMEIAVASLFDIPVADNSADLLVNVFAPIVESEFARATKKGGSMVIAVPGKEHLFGLKEVLYEKPYENPVIKTEYPGFVFEKRESVCDTVIIQGSEMIYNLFTMTPYFWKTPKEGSEKLKFLQELTTPIRFDFLVYRRA
mgnify:CR=1 FL=1